jgi:hypothetical protein
MSDWITSKMCFLFSKMIHSSSWPYKNNNNNNNNNQVGPFSKKKSSRPILTCFVPTSWSRQAMSVSNGDAVVQKRIYISHKDTGKPIGYSQIRITTVPTASSSRPQLSQIQHGPLKERHPTKTPKEHKRCLTTSTANSRRHRKKRQINTDMEMTALGQPQNL